MDQQGTKFWTWLQDNGVTMNKVALHDFSSQGQGRGVIATEDIDKGELLFAIPKKFVMAVENDPEFGKVIGDNGPWLDLMSYMMECANRDHWKPYFDVLPTQFNTPMFWTDEQLEMLQGSVVVDKIGKQGVKDQHASLQTVYNKLDCDTSLDQFTRMGSIIMSYSFDVELEGQEAKAMCPPADMLNAHTKLCNAHLHHAEDEDSALEMRSIKRIAQGEQVYNTYGELPNSDLLRRYGYVEQGGTDFDVVEVQTGLIIDALKECGVVSDEQKTQLEQIVAELEQDEEEEFVDDGYDIGVSGEPDLAMLVTLEYLGLVLESDAKPRLQRELLRLLENDQMTEQGKQVLTKVCQLRIGQYPEDIQAAAVTCDQTQTGQSEEETLVHTEPKLMAREVLLGEVRILKRCQSWVEEVETVTVEAFMEKLASKRQKVKK